MTEEPKASQPAVPGWGMVFIALILLGHFPLLYDYGVGLWNKSHYQFYPALLVGSWILFRVRSRQLGPLAPASLKLAAIPFGISIVLLGGAAFLQSPWLAAVALLATLAGVILAWGGAPLARAVWPAWAFLWLGIRPPLDMDGRLVRYLQTFTARWVSLVLDGLDILHRKIGNVIELSGGTFLVEDACSGVNSLFSIIACTVFYCIWSHRGWVRSGLLLATSVWWVLVMNVTRAVSITAAHGHLRWDRVRIDEGWLHEVFGGVLFGAALLLILSSDRFIAFFAGSVSAPPPEQAQSAPTTLPPFRSTLIANPIVPVLFAALFGAQLWLQQGPVLDNLFNRPVSKPMPPVEAQILPVEHDGWRRTHFEFIEREQDNPQGQYSQMWKYRKGDLRAIVSYDYHFVGHGYLEACYEGLDWVVDSLTPHERFDDSPRGANDGEFHIEVHMRNEAELKRGYLLFASIDLDGQTVRRLDPMARRFTRELRANALRTTFKVQVLIESHLPLQGEEIKQARSLFKKALRTLKDRELARK